MSTQPLGNTPSPQLPIVLLANEGDEDSACGICFEDYDEKSADKAPVTLLCNHIFCRACLDLWKINDKVSDTHYTCPMCRQGFEKKQMGFLERVIGAIFGSCICMPVDTHEE